jgi:hypothetical protein
MADIARKIVERKPFDIQEAIILLMSTCMKRASHLKERGSNNCLPNVCVVWLPAWYDCF